MDEPNNTEAPVERVPIRTDADIVVARRRARELAAELGFSSTDLVLITTAISELARNIVLYARSGEIVLQQVANHGRPGIVVVAEDQGPGIDDVEQALR